MAVVFPEEGIEDGDYQRIVGNNYGKIREFGELSKEKGYAKDHMLDLRIQETIPIEGDARGIYKKKGVVRGLKEAI